MKIYFAGSIRGGRKYRKSYETIVDYLKKFGTVLTEHIGNKKISNKGENLSSRDIYQRDLKWLKSADIIIAEVSNPSLGVGYEIAIAEKLGKRVLCLFREQKAQSLSAMIAGNKKLQVKKYANLKEALKIIDVFLFTIK